MSNLSEHAIIPISVMGYIYLSDESLGMYLNYRYGLKIITPIIASYSLITLLWYKLNGNRNKMIKYINHNNNNIVSMTATRRGSSLIHPCIGSLG